MTEKIIFLDIDGVLRTDIYNGKIDSIKFDSECVKWFNKLIEETNAKVVISSTNRIHGLNVMVNWFKTQGVKCDIIDVTPIDFDLLHNRGQEIDHWLYLHDDPQDFIIIDDKKNGIPQVFGFRFIQTNSKTGFKEEHYLQAKRILNE